VAEVEQGRVAVQREAASCAWLPWPVCGDGCLARCPVLRAVAAGGSEMFPVADQPYGMRQGRVVDPFGHIWYISTRKENMSAAEMTRRYEDLM
jgi:hypothetical protein